MHIEPLYLYHPSARQDLQSPFALTPLSPAHNLVLIDNHYLTRVHSAKDPNVNTYSVYMYLPHDMYYKHAIWKVLTQQLTHMQTASLPTSTERLHALQGTEISTYPAQPELDDEPITSTTQITPTQLDTCPYCFTVTMPTYNPATYGLFMLAYMHARWTTSIPDTLIPTSIANNIW